MNSEVLNHNIQSLRYQRNVLLAFAMIISLALLISLTLLIFKRDRVIIVPSVVGKEFWVDANSVSSSYLEQQGVFLSKFILEKTSQSAASQREIVLRHTDSGFAGILRKKLIEEEEMLRKQNSSYVFFPIDVQVDPNKMEVRIIGERIVYVSDKPISKEKEQYVLGFVFTGTGLLLKSLTSEKRGEP